MERVPFPRKEAPVTGCDGFSWSNAIDGVILRMLKNFEGNFFGFGEYDTKLDALIWIFEAFSSGTAPPPKRS